MECADQRALERCKGVMRACSDGLPQELNALLHRFGLLELGIPSEWRFLLCTLRDHSELTNAGMKGTGDKHTMNKAPCLGVWKGLGLKKCRPP